MMCRLSEKECWRRAFRTFLQTACGVLAAGIVAAVTKIVEQEPGWKTGLVTLIASSISAGIAAVMNRSSSDQQSEAAENPPDAEHSAS